MRDGSTLLGILAPRRGPIGGGGYVTGGNAADDGTLVCRTDTFNGYVRSPGDTEWTPLIRPGSNIAASDILFDPTGQGAGLGTFDWGRVGCWDIGICATNSNVIYLHSMFALYKTTDKGATLTKLTSFPTVTSNGMNPNNATNRTRGRSLAVDPQNANHVLIDTPSGVYRTTDGGTNWTLISTASLPARTDANYRNLIAFDRSSSVVGGITQRIYVFCNDGGLRKSEDGGATWAAVGGTGAPTTAAHLVVHPVTGYVFTAGTMSGATSAQLYRYASGAWTTPAVVTGVKAIAISPHNAAHMYAQSTFGSLYGSTDYGVTWFLIPQNTGAITFSTPEEPWRGWLTPGISNGDLVFDPSQNRLILFEGYGVAYYDTPATAAGTSTPVLWQGMSTGIDQIVTQGLTCNPNGTFVASCHDKGFFTFSKALLDAGDMVGRGGPSPDAPLTYAQSADYAIDDPTFWAVAVTQTSGTGTGNAFYSNDDGADWTAFASLPSGLKIGNIAVSTTLNMVWVPSVNSGQAHYTLDGGATWNPITIGGLAWTRWSNNYNLARNIIAADKNNEGHFYLFCHGVTGTGSTDLSVAGFWKSTDGGATWSRTGWNRPISSATIGDLDFYNAKLKQVVEQPGHFLFTGGNNTLGLYKSTDYCANWTKVGPMTEVYAFGTGKAKYGASYPTILAVGWGIDPADSVSKYGWWFGFDGGTTWAYDRQFWRNVYDAVLDICGDPNDYGRWLLGYAGKGVDVVDYDYTLTLS